MIRAWLNGTEYPENYLSWKERKEVLSRSETFKGVMIEQSLELQFIGDAFDYIVSLDDEYDVAAVCTVEIKYYHNLEGWKVGFDGYLDFTSLKKDNKGSKKLTISAYSDDFSNKILKRMDIEIPYDRLTTLDGDTITPFADEYQTVQVDGIEVVGINVPKYG